MIVRSHCTCNHAAFLPALIVNKDNYYNETNKFVQLADNFYLSGLELGLRLGHTLTLTDFTC